MNFPLLPFAKKVWPVASKMAIKSIKKKLFFHELCLDLDIKLHEDEFDLEYLQSLAIFLRDQEHSWAEIFQLPDVRKAFHTGYPINDLREVARLLEHHLHVTIKKGPLKQLNTVPVGLLDTFVKVYSDQAKENLKPSTMETIRAATEIKEEGREHFQELKGLMGQMIQQQALSNENYVQRSDFEQSIDAEHQAQLNLIKKALEQNQTDTALSNLFELKERVWEKATKVIKYKLLNNIGYTYMQKHDYDTAIIYYEQACEFDPENAGNLSNLAGLYFVKQEYDKAEEVIAKIKESHPGLAVAAELYQAVPTSSMEEIEAIVPEHLKNDPETLVALINIAVKKSPRVAVYYAKRLYDNKPDSENFQDIYCNIISVALIGERIDFNVTELMSDEDKEHLALSRQLLETLWSKIKVTEAKKYSLQILERLNLVLTVLGDNEAALKVACELIEEDTDAYFGRKQAGINLMFLERYAEAAEQFATIGEDHENLFEYHTSWLLALGKIGRMEDARRIGLKQLERTDRLAEDELRVFSTLGFLYTVNEQYNEALEFVEKAEALHPNGLNVLADKAKIQRKLEDITGAKKTEQQMLRVMKEHLPEQTLKDRYLAAHYFRSIKRFKETAELLESIADITKDHYLTNELIHAYTASGRKAKALGICIDLRERYGPGVDYTRREIEIYYQYHDYDQAENVLNTYVEKFPGDIASRLNLAGLQRRNGHSDELKVFCQADLSQYEFSVREMQGYLEILNSQGYHQKSLKLVYNYRRAHPGMESNKLFVDYCLLEPDDRKNSELPEQVDKNTVVTLASGTRSFTYTVLDLPDTELKKQEGEINLNDPIYQKIKGLEVGKTVNLNNNPLSEWTISKILPLYMATFQQAVEENSTIYAATSKYITGEIKDIGDIERFVDGQLQQQRRFTDLMVEQEKNYEAYQLPLGAFAIFNKTSPIEVYEYFIAKSIGIRYSAGDANQYNVALQTATEQQFFVPDITALMTLYKSGFNLPEGMPKFIIGNVTADLIDQYIQHKTVKSDSDHISFFEENGQKLRMIITAEHKQEEIKRLQNFRDWVKQVTETRPCLSLLEYEDKKSKQFKKAMGADVFESALLSVEVGGIYISDDAANRRFVLEELRINSIWTQPFFKALTIRSLLSEQLYGDHLFKLILLGHQHTTVDKNDIITALHLSRYKISGPFEAAVTVLSGYHSDERSVGIAFQVIADIWQLEQLTPKYRETLTYYVLMRFMTGRSVYPLISKLYRLSDYFITDQDISLIVKHAIWQLMRDQGFPLKNPAQFLKNRSNK